MGLLGSKTPRKDATIRTALHNPCQKTGVTFY